MSGYGPAFSTAVPVIRLAETKEEVLSVSMSNIRKIRFNCLNYSLNQLTKANR